MKNVLKLLLAACLFVPISALYAQSYNHLTARHTPDWFTEGCTYQLMPRCFSAEGTLKGAERELERLHDMGVKVVYFTPLTIADTDMDTTMWSPRQLKSKFNDPRNMYRTYDYFHVDPEYGTDQDLKDFISHAHSLGMKVFVDLVFAHCGPTSPIVKEHPEFFKRTEKNEIKLTGWHFPEFDFSYCGTRAYFRTVMSYYVADFGVDGFRCDVADLIPIDFWEEVRGELDRLNKDLVVMAEGRAIYNTRYAFDGNYCWETLFKSVLKVLHGDKKVMEQGGGADVIRQTMLSYLGRCPKGTLIWNMTENHDTSTDDFENRQEKVYGTANCELSLAFCFALEGVPLLFSGQEVAYDRRVSMFGHEGVWINWKECLENPYSKKRIDLIRSWNQMRRDYSSLAHGETIWVGNDNSSKVCSFVRHDGKSKDILFVANCSDSEVKVRLEDGKKFTLAPWGYYFGENK